MHSLKLFKFSDDFCPWVGTLYPGSSATVCNNGFASQSFDITRGVRQGCPSSPYIFILCVELLAMKVNANANIRGISVLNQELKILQYADDTILILDGSNNSLRETVLPLNVLESASGLKINFDKSNIFPLGPLIAHTPAFLDYYSFNFMPNLSRLKSILKLWSIRDLNPISKIVLVENFWHFSVGVPTSVFA